MAIAPLQIPGYSASRDIDWAPLSELGNTLQSNRMNNQRRDALSLAALGQGGTIDYGKAANSLASIGDIDGATKFAAMQKALSPESTPDIQNFNYANKNPQFVPFLKQQAEAKSTKINNTTNVNNIAEKEYDKQNAKDFAEMNRKMIEWSQAARMKIGTLTRLDQLLSNPNIYTGTGAEQVLAAKKLAKAVGVDVGDVSGPEAIRSIGNQFALELRNPAGGAGMPGALSDKDREFLQQSVPGLGQTPDGNKKIVDYMKRVAQRSLDVDRLRQDYVRKNKRLDEGFYRELDSFSNANPLFPEGENMRGQTQRSSSRMSPQDVDASVSNARATIARNPAARDAVIKRLRENGIDPNGL